MFIYRALATDYDGTLAREGRVASTTLAALERAKGSGLKLLLVTGRQLPDLEQVFPALGLFDRVVAENGALLYRPADATLRLLAAPPQDALFQRLSGRGIPDLAMGKVILATRRPYEGIVSEVIQEMGLRLRIIFNKDAVMVLPPGVDKGSGLQEALVELGVSWEETVGVGDAENDRDFLSKCGLSAAVANALPETRKGVQLVTGQENGGGVVELIDKVLG